MKRVDVEIRPDVPCKVVGHLYMSDDATELGEDMLEVSLENGILIDAGWHPEGQLSGCYVVSVTQGLERLIPSQRAADVYDAARLVSELASRFAGNGSRPATSA